MYLPNEIWHSILSSLPTQDLLACARVSRALHAVAVQLLYHDVCIDTAWPVSLRRQAALTPIMERKPTRVRRHRELLHTLRKNQSLLLLVRSATFLMLGESSRRLVTGNVREIFRELAKSKSPAFIHLSCQLDMYWSFLASYAQIRSLRLKTLLHHEEYAATFRRAAELEGLEHLTIADLLWLEPMDDEDSAMANALLQCEERCSDIRTLTFLNSHIPRHPEFELVLKWPTALRSFCYEFWSLRKDSAHTVPDPPLDIPQLFYRALNAQADTLEEVHIIGADWQDLLTRLAFPPRPEPLNFLTRVKKLSLPMNFLAFARREQVETGDFIRTLITPPLHACLPASLEQLQLQLPRTLRATEIEDQSWNFNLENVPPHQDFVDWLCELAEHHSESCPHLTQVAVYWQGADPDRQIHVPSVNPAAVAGIRQAYKGAGIELSVGPSAHGPLFGLGN